MKKIKEEELFDLYKRILPVLIGKAATTEELGDSYEGALAMAEFALVHMKKEIERKQPSSGGRYVDWSQLTPGGDGDSA